MTRRLLIALLLLPALLVGTGVSVAQAGSQNIRSTAEYRELKAYVGFLAARKSSTVTPAEVQKFKTTLAKKRAKANGKVRSIYTTSMQKAKAKRLKQRNNVRKLKAERQVEVTAIKSDRQSALNSLTTAKNRSIDAIDASYDTRIANLQKNLKKLQRKYDRATKPSVRKLLKVQILDVQGEINTEQRNKQSDINAVLARYRNQTQQTREKYTAKIARAKAEWLRDIKEAEATLREAFDASRTLNKERKSGQMATVRATYERGVTYIKQMKVNGPND